MLLCHNASRYLPVLLNLIEHDIIAAVTDRNFILIFRPRLEIIDKGKYSASRRADDKTFFALNPVRRTLFSVKNIDVRAGIDRIVCDHCLNRDIGITTSRSDVRQASAVCLRENLTRADTAERRCHWRILYIADARHKFIDSVGIHIISKIACEFKIALCLVLLKQYTSDIPVLLVPFLEKQNQIRARCRFPFNLGLQRDMMCPCYLIANAHTHTVDFRIKDKRVHAVLFSLDIPKRHGVIPLIGESRDGIPCRLIPL